LHGKGGCLKMSDVNCSLFVIDWDNEMRLCRCPSCKGYLPREFPLGKQFQCMKCGTVLETMPSLVEDPDDKEDTEYRYGGRICVVPEDCITMEVIDVKANRKTKPFLKKTDRMIVTDLGFKRRVWEDRKGLFIKINGKKVRLERVTIALELNTGSRGGIIK